MRPSAEHPPYRKYEGARLFAGAADSGELAPNRLRWNPLPIPDKPTDLIEGIVTMAVNQAPETLEGVAVHLYLANRDMAARAFANADGEMLFVSIHADPTTDYPFYWGHAEERGEGAGEGKTLNLPLPRGTQAAAYLAALEKGLQAIRDHGAELIVLSFGADTFEEDPISQFKLRCEDYPVIAGRIASLGLPVLVVMEGGYAVDALGHNVDAFLSGFEPG